MLAPLAVLALAASASAQLLTVPYSNLGRTYQTKVVNDGPRTDFGTLGVSATGNGIKMASPTARLYLVNEAGNKYEQVVLRNRQISVDVNVAGVKCGYNAAFYFASLPPNAAIGTQYCDGQKTCNEMDIVEANIAACAVTTHGCTFGGNPSCDPWGCGINTKSDSQVGPKKYIDTTQTYTVTVAFYTDNGQDSGTVNKITTTFSQSGKTYSTNALTTSSCSSGQYWGSSGGFSTLSRALGEGMTMIFSFWGGSGTDMSWLDGGNSNPSCSSSSNTNTAYFSNIRITSLGGGGNNNPPPTTTRTTTKANGGASPTPGNNGGNGGNCAAKWGQCGGQGFNGPTCCQSGSTCTVNNQWYSQCL